MDETKHIQKAERFHLELKALLRKYGVDLWGDRNGLAQMEACADDFIIRYEEGVLTDCVDPKCSCHNVKLGLPEEYELKTFRMPTTEDNVQT